jgi:hypothetical protein
VKLSHVHDVSLYVYETHWSPRVSRVKPDKVHGVGIYVIRPVDLGTEHALHLTQKQFHMRVEQGVQTPCRGLPFLNR